MAQNPRQVGPDGQLPTNQVQELIASTIDAQTLPTINANTIPELMRADLEMQGLPNSLNLLPHVQTTYDLSRALDGLSVAAATPSFLRLNSSTIGVGGAAITLAYTVPIGRRARIDSVVMTNRNTDPNAGIWGGQLFGSTIELGTAGLAVAIAAGKLVASDFFIGDYEPGLEAILAGANMPIYLDQGDTITMFTNVLAGTNTFSQEASVFGLEIDRRFLFNKVS